MNFATISKLANLAQDSITNQIVVRYWMPLLAYFALVGACRWAIIPSHFLYLAGHVLGEHWYSIYNLMLFAGTMLFFVSARTRRKPELAWRVCDLTICCAIVSLGCKFIPLRRPSGGMHGFPSGHALTAFAASSLLMNTFPKVAPYAFSIAVAVGWSRVEIHEHFVYQVLYGAAMGIMIGAAVSHTKDNEGVLLPRIFRQKRHSPPVLDDLNSSQIDESQPPASLIR